MKARIYKSLTGLRFLVVDPCQENIEAARDICPWLDDCEVVGHEDVSDPHLCFELRDGDIPLRQWR